MDSATQQALIKAGETILAENRIPDSEDLSLTISNTKTGQNLLLMGMGAKNIKGLKNNLDFMDTMEGQLFTPETWRELDFDQRVVLYQESRKSAKFRHDFMKSVQESVNVADLHVDLLTQNSKNRRKEAGTKDERRVVREKFTREIQSEYVLPANVKEVSIQTEDYEEGEEE